MPTRSVKFRSVFVAAALAALGSAAPAHANGRFPAAQHVLVQRSSSPGPHRIVLRTTFGFMASEDDGASWRWTCEEALGYQGAPFDPPYVLGPAGQLVVGLSDGMKRVGTDRCAVASDPMFASRFVFDLDSDATGGHVIAVTGDGAPLANHVYDSTNGGESFTRLGAGSVGRLYSTLEMARSNPRRVYLTAIRYVPRPGLDAGDDERTNFFYRSDDGGATIDELPFPAGLGARGTFIAAIDPTNADVVYVRAPLDFTPDLNDGGSRLDAPTVLLRTGDAGRSFTEIARTQGLMQGFAISDDGATLWYASPHPADGLFRSTNGGASFERVSTLQVQGMRFFDGALYAAVNFVTAGFALGRSTDGGRTFAPLLSFCDARGAYECPASAVEGSICAARWPLMQDVLGCARTPAADAGPRLDAGTGSEPPTTTTCACAAPGAPVSKRAAAPALALTFGALGAALTRARRRR